MTKLVAPVALTGFWALVLLALVACKDEPVVTADDAKAPVSTTELSAAPPVLPLEDECAQLVSIVNDSVEEVQKITSEGGSATGDLRRLATKLDGIVARFDALRLGNDRLKELARDYRGMAAETAEAAAELAAAVDDLDAEKMNKAQKRIVTAVQKEDPLVEAINRFCPTP